MSEEIRLEFLNEAVEYLSNRLAVKPEWVLITGTGLGKVVEAFDYKMSIPYSEIPNMPSTTVESHTGELKLVYIGEIPVLAFCGRFHYYEGHNMFNITFPMRLAGSLGVTKAIITNASGSLHDVHKASDICLITDHINLLPDNPLRGLTFPNWGDRFPDPKNIYDVDMSLLAKDHAMKHGITLREGIYACLQGPTLETRAELKFLKVVGADLVGMSTVPEVLVASQYGMKVLGLSVITNIVDPDSIMEDVLLEDVITAGNQAIQPLSNIISGVIGQAK